MAPPDAEADPPYLRLKPEAIAEFAARPRAWPKSTQFRQFFRKVKRYHGSVEKSWGNLVEGKPVPQVIAVAFAEYLAERMGREDASLAALFEPAEAAPQEGVWESPSTVFGALADRLTDRDEMYLHNRARDVLEAARMIAHTVGHRHSTPGDGMDEAACVRRGEAEINRSVEGLAAWFMSLMRGDPSSRLLMFVTKGGRRIGVSVILPLNADIYRRFSVGLLHHFRITPEDLDNAGGYPYLFAVCDPVNCPDLTVREKTLAQARTIFYQMGYFTRRLPERPSLVTMVTHPIYWDRLRRQGFVETGAFVEGTRYPVVSLHRSREGEPFDVNREIAYRIITTSIELFQIANRAEWEREDRVSGLMP